VCWESPNLHYESLEFDRLTHASPEPRPGFGNAPIHTLGVQKSSLRTILRLGPRSSSLHLKKMVLRSRRNFGKTYCVHAGRGLLSGSKLPHGLPKTAVSHWPQQGRLGKEVRSRATFTELMVVHPADRTHVMDRVNQE
jgi:hypothetical protein